MKFADLHLHTVFSDGTYTPQELIQEAARFELSSVALVDHDTVSGITPTLELANSGNLEVIPGIELTAEYFGIEVHILGYFIDYQRKDFIERLDLLKKARRERIYKILERLKKYTDIEVEPSVVFALAELGTVGRLHIARAMVKAGVVSSTTEAFQKYIGDKCSAYVAGFRLSPQEAISLIKNVGGIPVLAHPYTLSRFDLINEFVDAGLMGLEVYYPEHTRTMTNFYLELAKKFNLLVTGGSDCHGTAKPEAKIGSLKVPYELVEKLKEAKNRLG